MSRKSRTIPTYHSIRKPYLEVLSSSLVGPPDRVYLQRAVRNDIQHQVLLSFVFTLESIHMMQDYLSWAVKHLHLGHLHPLLFTPAWHQQHFPGLFWGMTQRLSQGASTARHVYQQLAVIQLQGVLIQNVVVIRDRKVVEKASDAHRNIQATRMQQLAAGVVLHEVYILVQSYLILTKANQPSAAVFLSNGAVVGVQAGDRQRPV